jgi:acetyl esterase
MVHGFFCMAGDLAAGAQAQAEAAKFLKSRLAEGQHSESV